MESQERRLKGVVASPPLASGRAVFFGQLTKERCRRISENEVAHEKKRFESALLEVDQQLRSLQEHFTADHRGTASLIIEAHQLMLKDPLLQNGTKARVEQELICAEAALRATLEEILQSFDHIQDPYLQERKSDVFFIGERLLQRLQNVSAPPSLQGAVVVAQDLSPIDVAAFVREGASAFITVQGGPTSHSIIVARSLGLPGVLGVEDVFESIAEGDLVLVDGTRGEILVRPSAQHLQEFEARRSQLASVGLSLTKGAPKEARTRDGALISLLANLELLEELPLVSVHHAAGVGLFRTEFLYMSRKALPTEEEQFLIAKAALSGVAPRPVTFRTLDIGGDKPLPEGFDAEPVVEQLRALRFCLKHPKIFRAQLRGLLRASPFGKLQILLPMVTSIEELLSVKALLADVRAELVSEGLSIPKVPLGAMIETPSAVLLADLFAPEVDFFSVGTNDLTQYTLAVERSEAAASEYYRPLHPALLRSFRMIMDAAKRAKLPVSLCGEMAAEPRCAPLLVGLGFEELSMTPSAIPAVRYAIQQLTLQEARALSDEASSCRTVAELEAVVSAFTRAHFPELLQAAP